MSTRTENPLKSFETELHDWISQEKAAVELINHISTLWYDRSVELVIFRNTVYNKGTAEILSLHTYAHKVMHRAITIFDTVEVTRALINTELSPSRIDIGRLTAEWIHEKNSHANIQGFLEAKIGFAIGKEKRVLEPCDVVLYGFGRIGRIAARELITQAGKGEQLRLRAIVTRSNSDADIVKRAALLRTDSVHGPFGGNIIEDLANKALIINGHTVKMIAANNPEDVDYESYGISKALVIDNTGVFRDRESLSRHLKAKGVAKVLLTAPGKGNVPNIVHGVNHDKFDFNAEQIYSAASCTTNAIIPPLKVLNDKFGIVKGHIETIHSYTNDQNLLDNYHKKERRGRSAPLNMVLTETGANSAITKVLPELSNKFTANAVRVPTPNVSLAILNLSFDRETSVSEVNEALRDAALNGDLVEQIQYSTDPELVSSDLIGNPCASIIDAPNTILSQDKKGVVVYSWYDNEYGYTRQVIRLAKHICNVVRLRYY